MATTIHHTDLARADARAMDDTTDHDPEVPERAPRTASVPGRLQGQDPGRVRDRCRRLTRAPCCAERASTARSPSALRGRSLRAGASSPGTTRAPPLGHRAPHAGRRPPRTGRARPVTQGPGPRCRLCRPSQALRPQAARAAPAAGSGVDQPTGGGGHDNTVIRKEICLSGVDRRRDHGHDRRLRGCLAMTGRSIGVPSELAEVGEPGVGAFDRPAGPEGGPGRGLADPSLGPGPDFRGWHRPGGARRGPGG